MQTNIRLRPLIFKSRTTWQEWLLDLQRQIAAQGATGSHMMKDDAVLSTVQCLSLRGDRHRSKSDQALRQSSVCLLEINVVFTTCPDGDELADEPKSQR